MSFFDKMKQGASDAAKKAQQTVEITKLKTQISLKEREIEKSYAYIGEAVFHSYRNGDWKMAGKDIEGYCLHITGLRRDISVLEAKIKAVKNEKECSCGKIVPLEVKYCPACGLPFDDDRSFDEV
ncbi:zinc ribbon domain-containing protein [Paenibacillus sp. TAB 01]|uniref:zinc ribbon domain-containing protein n=1 Tax=Paenibacillus sp. TAB 01 TaxID=3368988 RepID=UPI0037526A8B